MAYMSKYPDGTLHGPNPNKRGEFCGNYNPGLIPPMRLDVQKRSQEYLSQMRFGKPGKTKPSGLSIEDLLKAGFVGLYLLEDRPLSLGDVAVETDALTEAVVSVEPKFDDDYEGLDWDLFDDPFDTSEEE